MRIYETSLEVLPTEACWERLRSRHVGRIAYVLEGQPEVIPVNYLVLDDALLFRSDEGTKLAAVLSGEPFAFQVDHVDPDFRTGWSVLVKGRAKEMVDPRELRRVANLPLRPWARGEKAHWVRVIPHEVTGRRIVVVQDR